MPNEPTIAFRKWEPPKPTLDQMPEGDPHRCLSPMGYEVLAERIGDYAVRVWPNYPSSISSRYPGYSGRYTVLDADPTPPETLADVPPRCWCLDDEGIIWHEDGSVQSIYNLSETARDPSDCVNDLADYKITRVLGFPVLNNGKGE